MLGRGTRLCPDLFAPGEHKQFFYLFDYCQNLEFFSENPDSADAPLNESLGTRLFKARLAVISELDGKLAEGRRAAQSLASYDDRPDDMQFRNELAISLHQNVAAT